MDNPRSMQTLINIYYMIHPYIMKLVIVTGITGIDKRGFIDKFRKQAGIDALSDTINFEEVLVNKNNEHHSGATHTDITTFLNLHSSNEKGELVNNTFHHIPKHKFNKEYVFLNVHLTYYRNNEYFPPFNPENYIGHVSDISGDLQIIIINLIDDAYNIWKSISDKDQGDYRGTKITLREILGWRSLEALMSESLANLLANRLYHNKDDSPSIQKVKQNVKSYMVSVRHPHSTFENLIKPKTPACFYLSFPITEPRKDKSMSMIKEINNFRAKMHELGKKHKVAIFDPVTIDELYLYFDEPAKYSRKVTIKDEMRWPLEHDVAASQEPPAEIKIPRVEIKDSEDHIDHQIRSRDYKLVEYSKYVFVFRPYFGGESTGVKEEINHAINSGVKVLMYLPDNEKLNKKSPFNDDSIEIINTETKFYNRVEALMKQHGENAYI